MAGSNNAGGPGEANGCDENGVSGSVNITKIGRFENHDVFFRKPMVAERARQSEGGAARVIQATLGFRGFRADTFERIGLHSIDALPRRDPPVCSAELPWSRQSCRRHLHESPPRCRQLCMHRLHNCPGITISPCQVTRGRNADSGRLHNCPGITISSSSTNSACPKIAWVCGENGGARLVAQRAAL